MSKKRGLWDNIHAKRERIKHGSGERMRKPGSKGAPTKADFKASQATSEENTIANVRGLGYVTGDPAIEQDAIVKYQAGNVVDTDSASNQLFKKVKEVHTDLHASKTAYQLRTHKESVELDESAKRVNTVKRVLKSAHDRSKHFKTKETSEPQSTHSDDPDSRFDATDSAVRIYKKDTPGQ
jgi:hypothetical protein